MAKGHVASFGTKGGLPPTSQGAIGTIPSISGPGRGVLAVRSIGLCLTALPLFLALPSGAWAEETPPPTQPGAEPQIEFSSDQVIYDSDADVVTAQGQVRMEREGNYLAADQVVWDRKSGRVL